MRKILFVLFLLLPATALAQTTKPQPAIHLSAIDGGGAGSTVTSKPEEKTKPVIVTNAKKQELIIASLQLENAKLRLKEFQDTVTKAETEVAKFWQSLGIDPATLAAKWDVSDGQNGDIILTPKKEVEKPKAP